jgi:hypothetical protein
VGEATRNRLLAKIVYKFTRGVPVIAQ